VILRSLISLVALTASTALAVNSSPRSASLPDGNSCARFAATSTSYQQHEVMAALANNPTGKCVGPGTVQWSHPMVIMKVPPAPDTYPGNCPTGGDFDTGWTCVYNNTNFNGTQLQFHDCCYYQDLQAFGGSSWVTLSFINTRRSEPPSVNPFRSWLNQYTTDPHGHSYCMQGESSNGDINNPAESDRWILLTNVETHC
jgi:hypothetical protein